MDRKTMCPEPTTCPNPHDPVHSLVRDAAPVPTSTRGAEYVGDLEEALEQAQANLLRYQELFKFAPDGYLVTDFKGIIRQANHAAAAMLNTRKEFLVGKPLLFYVAEEHRRAFAVRLFDLRQEPGSRDQWELALRPRKGEPLYVLVSVAGATEDRSAGLRWTFRDISRRQQAEEALRAEKEFADRLIELAETAIVVLGPSTGIVRPNPFFCTLTGFRPGDLLARRLTDLLVPDDRPSFEQDFARVAGNKLAHGIHRLQHRDGSRKTMAWSARLLSTSAEGQLQMLFVGSNITELLAAQERAVQAERLAAIGEMVAGLAHESRNALQRNQACLSVLALKLADRPAELELVSRMQRAQDDLTRHYDEVREYAAPVQLNRRLCHLADLWREAWADLVALWTAKKAELKEECGCRSWQCVVDAFRLKQVFRNLLENALAAAAEPARVVVRCAPAELNGQAAIQVAICDNGSGFAIQQRLKVFEPFFTTKLRGTGLGLAICKRVVEAHGGRIEAGEGPGGRVIITLPRSEE